MRSFLLAFVLLASVLLACSSSSDDTSKACTLLDCSDGAMLQRDLSIPEADIQKYTLTVCRNGSCSSGKLIVSSMCQLKGDLKPRLCAVTRATGDTLRLQLIIPASNPKDGDEYTVKLVNDTTGAAPVDVKSTVTYSTSQPNGPDCEPTCRTATL